MPKVGSSYACLAVILIGFVPEKDKTIIHKCFQKNVNALKKKNSDKQQIISPGSNFDNIVFEGVILIMYFLREQF